MPIYDKPVWGLLEEAVDQLSAPFSRSEIVNWFSGKYPLVKRNTVTSHITSCCVNDKNRHHYTVQKPILFKLDDGRYDRYDINKHGHVLLQEGDSKSQVFKPNTNRQSYFIKASEDINGRIDTICGNFNEYLTYLDRSPAYTGPSVHFHLKTMNRFRELKYNVFQAAKDERFCELLYATLVSWGMHRMDKGAKMPDFETFTIGIGHMASKIEELSNYRITALSQEDTAYISGKLWLLITSLPGSTTNSRLVANSKALHHFLPHLVPPIDRANTAFFFDVDIQNNEKKAFEIIYPNMILIAKRLKYILDTFDYVGFNSSETKVIDNAIIGYRIKHKIPKRLSK